MKRIVEVVEVRWIDSEAVGTWTPLAELAKEFKEIVTVGLLLHRDTTLYVVASSYDPETDSLNAAICIPATCVTKVTALCAVSL